MINNQTTKRCFECGDVFPDQRGLDIHLNNCQYTIDAREERAKASRDLDISNRANEIFYEIVGDHDQETLCPRKLSEFLAEQEYSV